MPDTECQMQSARIEPRIERQSSVRDRLADAVTFGLRGNSLARESRQFHTGSGAGNRLTPGRTGRSKAIPQEPSKPQTAKAVLRP